MYRPIFSTLLLLIIYFSRVRDICLHNINCGYDIINNLNYLIIEMCSAKTLRTASIFAEH